MTASFSTDGACQFYCILAIEETDFMLRIGRRSLTVVKRGKCKHIAIKYRVPMFKFR